MDTGLRDLLREIYEFGEAHDQGRSNKMERMRNVTPETGALLALLVGATSARRVLEVGTSNGYSTLWLADAVRPLGGSVTTLEFLPAKAELARANFGQAGLGDLITLIEGDAGDHLRSQPIGSYEFIFLDSDRTEYPTWWPDLQRVLVPGGLIVVDNLLSHAAEIQPFIDRVAGTEGYQSLQLPVGLGVQLIFRELT